MSVEQIESLDKNLEESLEKAIEEKTIEGKPRKAVALLSGGLDSTLATKLIKDMGFEITALNFHTAFCTCNKKGCQFESKKVSDELDISLKIMNVTKEYLSVVRNPKYGYGSGINPCIDCRIFMFKKAKQYMEEIGASFVITGEVVGQRPMSQNSRSMRTIEKESGLDGLILRPLTTHKYKGGEKVQDMIDFDSLPAIKGRGRRPQLDLAKDLNIENFICGTGGCALTMKEFALKLKDHFDHNTEDNLDEIKLLKIGRHYRLDERAKLLVGKDEKDNEKIGFYKHVGLYLEPEIKGPCGLLIGSDIQPEHITLAAKIMGRYCREDAPGFIYFEEGVQKNVREKSFSDEETISYRIC